MTDELADLLKLAKESGGTAQIIWRNKAGDPLAFAVAINGLDRKQIQTVLDGLESILDEVLEEEGHLPSDWEYGDLR